MNNCEHTSPLLTDLYQLTMMQGYYLEKKNTPVVFDVFFRKNPFNSGYVVFAGLETLIEYIHNIRFNDEDLNYLRSLGLFQESFLSFLQDFKFQGDIYSVEEGEIVFPHEPIVRIHANILEAQFLETISLNILNFQTLIATKAARIVNAASGKNVLEFGLRRAHGIDGALSASRAAFIGGVESSSNVLSGKKFGIPVRGTMAHSWVMAFTSEQDSFDRYADIFPHNTILLVDTYNTLEKGVPAAIQTLKRLQAKGIKSFGIRIDSGDLEYLSKESRKMLDEAGLQNAIIVASNDLDEYIIEELEHNQAPIDAYGVGTNLITAKGDPALSGVYKLAAREENGKYIPSIKVSNNPDKTTNPHIKNILRIYHNGLMNGDLVFLEEEKEEIIHVAQEKLPLTFFHPQLPYEYLVRKEYDQTEILLQPILKDGKQIYDFPDLVSVQKKSLEKRERLHHSVRRFLNAHNYKVSLTRNLRDLKLQMIQDSR